jgi:hypothetical protein
MMEKLADLLIDTETALWEARAINERERSAASRQALRTAQERLAAVQAEADRALWAGAK